MNTLQTIHFPQTGDLLVAGLSDNGEPVVAVKPICRKLGLDWPSQYTRIKNDSVLNEGIVLMPVPSDGGEQEAFCLPIKYVNGWLFKIDSRRVNPEARERVIAYQKYCYEVLSQHFFGAAQDRAKPKSIESAVQRPQFSPLVEKIEDVIAYLSDHQLRVLHVLQTLADHQGRIAHKIAHIAEQSGISYQHAHRILCLLLCLNVIETKEGEGYYLRHIMQERAAA